MCSCCYIELRTAVGHAPFTRRDELAFGVLDFEDYRRVFKFWIDGLHFEIDGSWRDRSTTEAGRRCEIASQASLTSTRPARPRRWVGSPAAATRRRGTQACATRATPQSQTAGRKPSLQLSRRLRAGGLPTRRRTPRTPRATPLRSRVPLRSPVMACTAGGRWRWQKPRGSHACCLHACCLDSGCHCAVEQHQRRVQRRVHATQRHATPRHAAHETLPSTRTPLAQDLAALVSSLAPGQQSGLLGERSSETRVLAALHTK